MPGILFDDHVPAVDQPCKPRHAVVDPLHLKTPELLRIARATRDYATAVREAYLDY